MLLGIAIGDALGNTTETMLPSKRSDAYGRSATTSRKETPIHCTGLPSQRNIWHWENGQRGPLPTRLSDYPGTNAG